jgi:type II secretory pathway pseudopilin PulG
MSTRVKVIAGCLVPLLVLGGAGVAVAIKLHHDSQVTAQHSRAAAAAKQREQQLQQQQQVQQTQRATKISARQDAETQLQTAITKDATDKANQGVLTSGPAQSTSCTGVSGGSSQSLSESTGTYNCIAVYQTASDGTQSGYRYSGTIDFDTGSMTWQLGASG